jgi:hypothetical protein
VAVPTTPEESFFGAADQNSHLSKTKKTPSGSLYNLIILTVFMAPEVGLEPTTLRLPVYQRSLNNLRAVTGNVKH